jgi:type VI secretion system protein ImpB
MASGSTQKWVGRNRPPRVQITYDVETGGAIENRELPFVVGVIADLSPGKVEREPLRTSRFVEIDRDSFDKVLEKVAPKAEFVVDDHIKGSGQLKVDVTFTSMSSFDPLNVIAAVPELHELLETRKALVDLQTKLYGNDRLEQFLQALLKDPGLIAQVRGALPAPTSGTDAPKNEAPAAKNEADTPSAPKPAAP